MNQTQVIGALRIAVPFLCTMLASYGFPWLGDSAIVAQITSAAIAVGSVAWSIYDHTNVAKLATAAAVDPGIRILVPPEITRTDPKVASLVADTNVPNVVKLTPGL